MPDNWWRRGRALEIGPTQQKGADGWMAVKADYLFISEFMEIEAPNKETLLRICPFVNG